jgi:2-keto-3-deoxy-L-fuconate dehydrogenase
VSTGTAPVGEFGGLVPIVTGGASGIGAATARLLTERGARVAVFDRNADGGLPAGLAGYAVDVQDRAAVVTAVEAVAADLGGIDIVVNSAGMAAAPRPRRWSTCRP